MHRCTLVVAIAVVLAGVVVLAGGRGGHVSRGAAHSSVHRSATHTSRNVSHDVNRNVSRNVNRNVSRNVNVNRNVGVHRDIDFDRDIDIDVDHHYGGWGYGCCYHPVATAAVATAAAVTTAVVVGSIVNSIPSSCETVSVGGLTYQHCGSTWYQPQFLGSAVNYVVVSPPR
jgi:hypothetical protein